MIIKHRIHKFPLFFSKSTKYFPFLQNKCLYVWSIFSLSSFAVYSQSRLAFCSNTRNIHFKLSSCARTLLLTLAEREREWGVECWIWKKAHDPFHPSSIVKLIFMYVKLYNTYKRGTATDREFSVLRLTVSRWQLKKPKLNGSTFFHPFYSFSVDNRISEAENYVHKMFAKKQKKKTNWKNH